MKQSEGRRMRGQGSIWQRADGVWAAGLSLGVSNRRRARQVMYGPSRDVVEAKLARAQMLLGSADGLPSKLALGDWLASWIDRAAREYALHTAASYRHVIGEMPAWLTAVHLGRLNGGHVQSWVDDLAGSPRTVASKRNMLRASLNDAMRRGLVTRNAAALARVPKQRRPKRTVLTAADCAAILAALGPQPKTDKKLAVPAWRYQAAAAVAIGCGLRQGELLGLSWSDVADGRITVRHTLTRVDGEYVRTPTKTEASEAAVPLPAFAARYLAAWDAIQAGEWQRMHPGVVDLAERRAGHVFTRPDGMQVNGSVVTHQFQARLSAAGLPVIPWHALRHATADLLADAGIGQTVTRDYLRHASYATTADHYTGSSRDALGLAAAALDRAMGE